MDRDTDIVRAYYDGTNPDGSPFTSELIIVNDKLKFIDFLDIAECDDEDPDHIMHIAYSHEEVNDEDYDFFMELMNPCHHKASDGPSFY